MVHNDDRGCGLKPHPLFYGMPFYIQYGELFLNRQGVAVNRTAGSLTYEKPLDLKPWDKAMKQVLYCVHMCG